MHYQIAFQILHFKQVASLDYAIIECDTKLIGILTNRYNRTKINKLKLKFKKLGNMVKGKPLRMEDVVQVLKENPCVTSTVKFMDRKPSKLEKHIQEVDRLIERLK